MRPDQAVKISATTFVLAAACGVFGILAVAARTPPSDAVEPQAAPEMAQRIIEESERKWVDAVTSGDAGIVEKTLADDFTGVGPDGNPFDKKTMVELIRGAPQEYISDRFDGMTVKFYGKTAVAQGSESWERRTEMPKKGRFVWSDTWMLRNGKWQIVAGVDYELPEASK
jgi:ketosteroid isomerase-like protein